MAAGMGLLTGFHRCSVSAAVAVVYTFRNLQELMPLAVKHLHSCPSSTTLKQAQPGRKEAPRLALLCKAGNKGKQKASRPGYFEVKVVSPPEVSLGIHQLPADTHNGDTISIKDQDFIVSSLTMRWRLEGGKYKRYHHRLDVESMSRSLLNRYLDDLIQKPAAAPKKQDF